MKIFIPKRITLLVGILVLFFLNKQYASAQSNCDVGSASVLSQDYEPCSGQPFTYKIVLQGNLLANAQYTLYLDDTQSSATGTKTDYSMEWTVSSVGTYTVKGMASSGCTKQMPGETVISYKPSGSSVSITASPSAYFICEGQSVSLTASGEGSYSWLYCPDNQFVSNLESYGSNSTIEADKTGFYKVTASDGCGGTTYAVRGLTVNDYPESFIISSSGKTVICAGESVTLTTNAIDQEHYDYQWYRGAELIYGATGKSYAATQAGTYRLKIEALGDCDGTSTNSISLTTQEAVGAGSNVSAKVGSSLIDLSDATPTGGSWSGSVALSGNTFNPSHPEITPGTYTLTYTVSQQGCTASDTRIITVSDLPNNYNYIIHNVLLKDKNSNGNTITESDISNLSISGGQMQQTYVYYDGLGRDMQQVMTAYSPESKKDVVTPIHYDAFGRQTTSYLPFVSSESNGNYKTGDITAQKSYYNNNHTGVVKDGEAYSITNYEPSPLNRITSAYGPGEFWHSNNKKTTFIYRTNTGTEVRKWLYDGASKTSISKDDNQEGNGRFYKAASLYVTETTDEQNSKTLEYKDKQDRVILKKVEDKTGHYLFTYYIYDDFSNLRMVIPPKACEILSMQSTLKDISLTSGNATVKNLCFTYDYDDRKRMISKQVPGAAPVYMVYDNRDRLRLTQDGVQRTKGTPEWSFTKYDALNRPVMSGIYKSSESQSTLNGLVNNSMNETRQNNALGYSQSSFPTSNMEVLSLTYYDDYGFLAYSSWDAEGITYGFDANSGLAITQQAKVNGQVTGSKIKVLGKEKWLNTVTYYDDRYQVIQTIQENYLGGYDKTSTQYSFTGQALKSKRVHHDGNKALTILEEYTYDHANRLLSVKHQIDSNPAVTLTQNEYNALGELVNKDLHSKSGSAALQSVDYRYNIRGWLQSVNHPSLKHDAVVNPDTNKPSDLFGFELLYERNTANLPVKP